MQRIILYALVLFSFRALGQVREDAVPVNLFTGKAELYFYSDELPQDIVRKNKIHNVLAYKLYPSADSVYKNLHYKEEFAYTGEKLPSFTSDPQLRNIAYTDGHLSSVEYIVTVKEGCYTNGVYFHDERYYEDYFYKGGKLSKIVQGTIDSKKGPRSITEYTYVSDKKEVWCSKYGIQYNDTVSFEYSITRQDKKGRPLCIWEMYATPDKYRYQLIESLPDNFTQVLLRQSTEWADSVLMAEYGNIENLDEKKTEKIEETLELRDSLDELLIDKYLEADVDGIACYTYKKNKIAGRVEFYSENLTRKDTFLYNGNQLVRWETWDFTGHDSQVPWENKQYNGPVKNIWSFEYDRKGRIVKCINRLYPLSNPEEFFTGIHELTYNEKGFVKELEITRTYDGKTEQYRFSYEYELY